MIVTIPESYGTTIIEFNTCHAKADGKFCDTGKPGPSGHLSDRQQAAVSRTSKRTTAPKRTAAKKKATPKRTAAKPIDSSSGLTLTPTTDRAWTGKQENVKRLSKLAAGDLGEAVAVAYLKRLGFEDAAAYKPDGRNNFPIDVVHDHESIEVKSGQVSNSRGAQQWRLTIGQPGKTETAKLATMDKATKRTWNAAKRTRIFQRKAAAMREVAAITGKPHKGSTLAVILNPATRTADVFRFQGFHQRIGYNSAATKAAYVESFRY